MNSTQDSSSHDFKKTKLTIIPPKQLFVNLTNDDENLTTPSPTTTSSSPTPLNAPSKTPSTNDTSPSQDTTPSSFQSKIQISPPSSNEPSSPQPLNLLLDNILDVSPRPSNPQPLQSHHSLDITFSLSPFENLKTSSPPSLPQPQPPSMGHPLYYNYHDYHRYVDVFSTAFIDPLPVIEFVTLLLNINTSARPLCDSYLAKVSLGLLLFVKLQEGPVGAAIHSSQ
ncbi:hypothetical protein Tco_0490324, partial [Tanacetum coccineum]